MPHGLSFQETKELWVRADLDGNGVFDYEELKVNWYKPVGAKLNSLTGRNKLITHCYVMLHSIN